MKLLTRLRESPHTHGSLAPSIQVASNSASKNMPESPYHFDTGMPEECEHIGVGAAMPQDVAGLDFLESLFQENTKSTG